MTVYTAHVYVLSGGQVAYFELPFDNEMQPELVVKDSIITDFADFESRRQIISDAFDANLLWDDEDPYTLEKEVDNRSWMDDSISKEFDRFCETVKNMNNVKYILFAVDSDKEDWMGYKAYWYNAKVVDFTKNNLFTIEWIGTNASDDDPFTKENAKKIIMALSKGDSNKIDTGDFLKNGKPAGKVTTKQIQGIDSSDKNQAGNQVLSGADAEEAKQIERISSLIKIVNAIDFNNKIFVFDRLDYVPVNGEFVGSESPNHPIIKRVIEAGGIMRKNVSGKTDYLVLDDRALCTGMSAKCKGALEQIDKGKNITIISVDNLLYVLGK